jgi:hypothetical protein
MPAHPFAPRDMADAYAVATDPARHMCRLDTIQSNWAFLKEARGQRVDLDRLFMATHLIRPAPHDDVLHVTLPNGRHDQIPVLSHGAPPAVARGLRHSDNLRALNDIDAARIGAIPAIRRAIGALLGGDEPKGVA